VYFAFQAPGNTILYFFLLCGRYPETKLQTGIVMKYLYLLLTLSIFSCNNWKENPAKVEAAIPDDQPGLIYKASFPEKTKTICFLSNNVWIVGSSDGLFYKTIDNGKTWTKNGNINPAGTVNCFWFYVDSNKKSYLFAGTDKGIYLSNDLGDSWKISFNNLTNKYPVINCFAAAYDYEAPFNIISAYGWDGKNDEFTSTNFGAAWSERTYTAYSMKSYYKNTFLFESIPYRTEAKSFKIFAANTSTDGFIKIVFLDGIQYQKTFASNKINEIIPGVGKVIYALTEKGIYVIVDNDILANKWRNIFNISENVFTLAQLSKSNLFIGASNGAYSTTNYGITWNRIFFENEIDTLIKIYNIRNRLYFVNSDGKVYYSDYSPDILSYVYSVNNINPLNNAELEKNNIILKWATDRSSSYNYSVQLSTNSEFVTDKTIQYNFIRGTEFKLEGLNSGVKYYWRVRAGNIFGFSVWSNTSCFNVK
jgi:hypothetical protein